MSLDTKGELTSHSLTDTERPKIAATQSPASETNPLNKLLEGLGRVKHNSSRNDGAKNIESNLSPATFQEKNTDVSEEEVSESDKMTIGPFEIYANDMQSRAFAGMLNARFEQFRDSLNLATPDHPVSLTEVSDSDRARLLERMAETFAPEHAAKFNIIVHGVFCTPDFSPLPSNLDNLLFHGTDASRGQSILVNGFSVPPERKVDKHPMYGTGISGAPVISKAAPYFNETGYSSRQSAEGVIFAFEPVIQNGYISKSALWGDHLPDGTIWQNNYDAVIALPKNEGGDQSASNFPETTLRSPEQAKVKSVIWAELIPASDPRYKHDSPLRYQPATPENPEAADASNVSLLNSPDQLTGDETGLAKLKKDLESELGIKLLAEVDAKIATGVKAGYEFGEDYPEGFELRPGEAVVVNLPESITHQDIRTLIIRHRKKSEDRWYTGRSQRRYTNIKPEEVKTENGIEYVFNRRKKVWIPLDPDTSYLVNKGGYFNERDRHPARSKIYARDTNTGEWVLLDTKIAEPRPNSEPEEERLHELPWHGNTDQILIVGDGQGDPNRAITNVHGIEAITYPDIDLSQPVDVNTRIFGKGIRFYDLHDQSRTENEKTHQGFGYHYGVQIGNGEQTQPFPLRSPEQLTEETNGQVTLSGGELRISLTSSRPVKSLEVCVGDTVYTPDHNNKAGWALLNAYIQKKDGTRVPLIFGENVPPKGILSGAPAEEVEISTGDQVVIGADNGHPAWLTGFRILQQ